MSIEFDTVEGFLEANLSPGVIVSISRAVGEDVVRQTMERVIRPLAGASGEVRLVNWFRYLVCA